MSAPLARQTVKHATTIYVFFALKALFITKAHAYRPALNRPLTTKDPALGAIPTALPVWTLSPALCAQMDMDSAVADVFLIASIQLAFRIAMETALAISLAHRTVRVALGLHPASALPVLMEFCKMENAFLRAESELINQELDALLVLLSVKHAQALKIAFLATMVTTILMGPASGYVRLPTFPFHPTQQLEIQANACSVL
jgi:hypothetical protein